MGFFVILMQCGILDLLGFFRPTTYHKIYDTSFRLSEVRLPKKIKPKFLYRFLVWRCLKKIRYKEDYEWPYFIKNCIYDKASSDYYNENVQKTCKVKCSARDILKSP